MKAAIYLRVSKDDGTMTVENQRAPLIQMALGRGYEVGTVYTDRVSGAKGERDRPGLAALFQDAARGQFQAVLVWALDRFSRDGSFTGGLRMVGELDRFRVALLSHEETYIDTAGPFREPLVALALKLAEGERHKLIERTKAGLARAKASGKRLGRPPAPPDIVAKVLAAAERFGSTMMISHETGVPRRTVRGILARRVGRVA
jgi:DNA invertase Pin-like site-specific DNA recombinase